MKHDAHYYLTEVRRELEGILHRAREASSVKGESLVEWVEAAIKKLDKAEAALMR